MSKPSVMRQREAGRRSGLVVATNMPIPRLIAQHQDVVMQLLDVRNVEHERQ